MLVGLFEPVAAPWSLDGVPGGFSFGKISPDWERMEPFLGRGLDRIPVLWSRPASHEIVGREHAAVREAAGLLDMSLVPKLLVQGPDAAAVLSRLSANDVTAGLGRLVYTQWLNEAGGIVADVTVTWLERRSSWSPTWGSSAGNCTCPPSTPRGGTTT